MALMPYLEKKHDAPALVRWLIRGKRVPLAARKAALAMALNPDRAWLIDSGARGDSSCWLNLLRWWNTFVPHLCTHEWLRSFRQVHLGSFDRMHPRSAAWFRARLGE